MWNITAQGHKGQISVKIIKHIITHSVSLRKRKVEVFF